MKIIVSSDKNKFWTKVINELSLSGIQIVHWIGENLCNDTFPNGCNFSAIDDIYENINTRLNSYRLFDIDTITTEEYYNYIKILDRDDNLGGFSFSKRDRVFKDLLSYWNSILQASNPDAIIFSNVPHLAYDYPLYLVAKKMKIKTMMFNMTPYADWCYITHQIKGDGLNSHLIKLSNNNVLKQEFKKTAIEPYNQFTYTLPEYMKEQINFDSKMSKRSEKFKSLYSNVKTKLTQNHKSITRTDFFTYVGENEFFSIVGNYYIRNNYHRRLKEQYIKNTSTHDEINKIKRYIYVPLHYQPEATTSPLGGYFSDQIYLIEHLRKIVPNDIAIIVKEHYSQFSSALKGYLGRDLNYWSRICSIKNVHLSPLDYNQKELIINSLAVATVTGTAGWEAIQYGKYCIAYGEAWYSAHPNTINYKDLDTNKLNDIIDNVKDKNDNVKDKNDEFLDIFCKSLLKVNLHSEREENYDNSSYAVASSIVSFLSNK